MYGLKLKGSDFNVRLWDLYKLKCYQMNQRYMINSTLNVIRHLLAYIWKCKITFWILFHLVSIFFVCWKLRFCNSISNLQSLRGHFFKGIVIWMITYLVLTFILVTYRSFLCLIFFIIIISSFDYSSLVLLQNNHWKKVFFSHWKANIACYLVTVVIQVNYSFLLWSHFYSFSFLSFTCCFG